MRVLGRDLRLSTLPTKVAGLALTCAKVPYTFKHPLPLLLAYLRSESPSSRMLELRNGWRLFLSGHEHDLITALTIFCRRDYGDVTSGSVVIDIGANIGFFSLYAAYMGARRVYSFEPNPEAYQCLSRNIEQNSLQNTVIPFELAVTARSDETVYIPISSSPYNSVQDQPKEDRLSKAVRTISLADILGQNRIERVPLLKIDCEGAEYTILPSSDDSTLAKIENIRMEYHAGPMGKLIARMEGQGLSLVKRQQQTPDTGVAWFSRKTDETTHSSYRVGPVCPQ